MGRHFTVVSLLISATDGLQIVGRGVSGVEPLKNFLLCHMVEAIARSRRGDGGLKYRRATATTTASLPGIDREP